MSSESSNYELGFQLKLENMAAELAFEELLDLAIETCLTDRASYEDALCVLQEIETDKTNTALLESVGVWGLRAHVDYFGFANTFCDGPIDERSPIGMSDLLTQPDIIPLTPNHAVRLKIEAFGQALIEEAFTCLGAEAPGKVREFQQAETVEQQEQVIAWLYDHALAIRKTGAGQSGASSTVDELAEAAGIELRAYESTEPLVVSGEPIVIDFRQQNEDVEVLDETSADDNGASLEEFAHEVTAQSDADALLGEFYHPARLSPKFIGTYPNTRVEPTCLGLSVLIASFFEKAGTPYLHAGVLGTARQSHRLTNLFMAVTADSLAIEHDMTLNHVAEGRLMAIETAVNGHRRQPRGHHALVSARLLDGSWSEIDLNYGHADTLIDIDSESLQKAYQQLLELQSIDRGASAYFENLVSVYGHSYWETVASLADQFSLDVPERFIDLLMYHDNPMSLLEDYLLTTLYAAGLDNIVDVQVKATKQQDKIAYLDEMLGRVIEDYFLAGMDVNEVAERCAADEAFRIRRVHDVALMPIYMLMGLSSSYESLVLRRLQASSARLETGLPAFRVGACALSDFSLYCMEEEVPVSFWAANWSSHNALEDHIPMYNDDSNQAEIARRLMSIIRSSTLRNYHGYGIILSFLEQGENAHDGEGS